MVPRSLYYSTTCGNKCLQILYHAVLQSLTECCGIRGIKHAPRRCFRYDYQRQSGNCTSALPFCHVRKTKWGPSFRSETSVTAKQSRIDQDLRPRQKKPQITQPACCCNAPWFVHIILSGWRQLCWEYDVTLVCVPCWRAQCISLVRVFFSCWSSPCRWL